MALRDYILHNFWLKLLSLGLATLTWFTIMAVQRNIRLGQAGTALSRTLSRQRIIVLKSATDMREFRILPAEVNVTVSAHAGSLQKLTEKDLQVYVNLTEVPDVEVLTKKVQVYVPEGVSLAEVNPPVVRIERILRSP
jgi:hypothetical protein